VRFGKSKEEAEQEPGRGGSGGDWIKHLKEGSTTFRIMEDPKDWTYYWEHFSPEGFSFPCPRDANDPIEDCPGCRSDNEKMAKASRKMAFNVLESFNGQEYINAYKVGPMVADKLENRYKRFDTLTDRDYTITKYKTSGDRWDFDVEGSMPSPVDTTHELKNIEKMLVEQYEENFGDDSKPRPSQKRTTIAPKAQTEEPPFEEEKVYQEADLRNLDLFGLLALLKDEMQLEPPASLESKDAIVDWLMELQKS